jgi:hypothetical protein
VKPGLSTSLIPAFVATAALASLFRPRDHFRVVQSPSGVGQGNPAWDFQAFIRDYEVGRRYTLVVRALYLPYESAQQLRRAVEPHRLALEADSRTKREE